MVSKDVKAAVEDEKETGRLEAFSDGVFSIAITLLVFNMKVPAHDVVSKANLLRALADQWPSYISYANSFLTLLIMWMNHHKLFRHIRKSDHVFMLLNGLLLMGVTFVPFPTAVLSEYLYTSQAKTAGEVYAGTYLAIALLFYALWFYAARGHRLLTRGHDRESVAAISRQYHFGPAMYLIAFVLAFVNVWACVIMCAALAIFFALPGLRKGSTD